MTAPKWTEAEDEMLRYLTAKGWSSARISANLPGRGRNAIIGRQHRIGLKAGPRRRTVSPSGMPLKPPRDHRDCATVNVTKLRKLREDMEVAVKAQPKKKVQADDGAPVPLMLDLFDLTEATCKWPVTDALPHKFCGHEKPSGTPYCSFHQRLAFTGSPPVKVPWRAAA